MLSWLVSLPHGPGLAHGHYYCALSGLPSSTNNQDIHVHTHAHMQRDMHTHEQICTHRHTHIHTNTGTHRDMCTGTET